jgi:hypothetical protein
MRLHKIPENEEKKMKQEEIRRIKNQVLEIYK